MKDKKKIKLIVLVWWPISIAMQILILLWLMVYGWGLDPDSWNIVIGGYLLLQIAWPTTIWMRVNFLKFIGVTKKNGSMETLRNFSPFHADLHNACQSYRHDFSMLTFNEQTRISNEAMSWLRAWGHALPQFWTSKEEGDIS